MRSKTNLASGSRLLFKLSVLALVLSLLVAACGGGEESIPVDSQNNTLPETLVTDEVESTEDDGGNTSGSSDTDLDDETSRPADGEEPVSVPALGAIPVRYSFGEYNEINYDLDITQDVEVEFTSLAQSALNALKQSYDVTNTLEGEISYTPGAENNQGYLPLHITASFSDGQIEGTRRSSGEATDGSDYEGEVTDSSGDSDESDDPVSLSDDVDSLTSLDDVDEGTEKFLLDLAEELGIGDFPPIDVTVWVDDQGKVQEVDTGREESNLFTQLVLEQFGSVSGLSKMHFERPFGPVFPEEPIDVGDTWTETISVEGPSGPIITEVEHILLDMVEAESDILIGQSVYVTPAYEIDFADFLGELFSAFSDENLEEATDSQLALRINVGETTITVDWNWNSLQGLVDQGTQRLQTSLATNFDLGQGESDGVNLKANLDQTTQFVMVNPV